MSDLRGFGRRSTVEKAESRTRRRPVSRTWGDTKSSTPSRFVVCDGAVQLMCRSLCGCYGAHSKWVSSARVSLSARVSSRFTYRRSSFVVKE